MADKIQIDARVENFAAIVRRYCVWTESAFGEPHEEMLAARKFLAELYLAVINVPYLESDEETEEIDLTGEWRAARDRFMLLPVDGYWDVFDPLKEDAPVFNLFSDDLADIYGDLKRGLSLYEQGKIAEAVWEWKFHFDIHWGAHLTGAQRAVQSYFAKFD